MQFDDWREFFKADQHWYAQACRQQIPNVISEEERYQHFKARLLSEVVAKETITYFGDIVGKKQYELGEKE